MSWNYSKRLLVEGQSGTRQSERLSPALLPEYAPIDGRSTEDLIKFAQLFASGLAFYDRNDEVSGNWSAFFDGDPDTMAAFLENPASFAENDKVRDSLSRPQLVLFLTFVKLLAEIRGRMNTLTTRHLDFYYREFLGLSPLPPIADQLHAIIGLSPATADYALPAGTQLSAGKDITGKPLVYTTDRVAYINQATLAELRSVFVVAPPEAPETPWNLYAASDATTVVRPSATSENSLAWRTLGAPIPSGNVSGRIGFGFASDLLVLGQGQRSISLTIGFLSEGYDLTKIQDSLSAGALRVGLGAENGEPTVPDTFIANAGPYLVDDDEDASVPFPNATLNDQTISEVDSLTEEDVGGCFVDSTGEVYLVESVDSTNGTAQVLDCGALDISTSEPSTGFTFYKPGAIYPQAIRLEMSLLPQSPAIEKSDTGSPPVLAVFLADLDLDDRSEKDYATFSDLEIDRISLAVSVGSIDQSTDSLTDGMINDLWIQNDDAPLQIGKPFYPWGTSAAAGASFYVAHPEICDKRIDQMTLDFDWVGAPADFATTYFYYPIPLTENSDLVADLKLCDQGSMLEVAADQPIFDTEYVSGTSDASLNLSPPPLTASDICSSLATTYPNFDYRSRQNTLPTEDFSSWERYWVLQLESPGFQSDGYGSAATTAAASGQSAPPPYLPKASSFSLGYSATTEWVGGEDNAASALHLHPFGWCATPTAAFLPTYDLQGQLYIGLQQLEPPATLSLLFQMADHSGVAKVSPPEVRWSYLTDNQWVDFSTDAILGDGTNGLLQTGIITLQIPEDATDTNTVLPAGTFWLRIAATTNATAVSATISIQTQAVAATFQDQGNASDHYSQPLPPDSLEGLVTRDPAIAQIAQPYSSSGGAPAEDDHAFYTRAAERLRHKSRAVTPWDYERLVLQQFPELYAALCLPMGAGEAIGSGTVTVAVIPDIRGQVPFDPYRPQPGVGLLGEVASFLRPICPSGVMVDAIGPKYLEITVEIEVKLREPVADEDLSREYLNEAILEYLSPWAFDESQRIHFGGRVYAGDLLAFIDRQPCVDYCRNIELYATFVPEAVRDVYSLETKVVGDYAEAVLPGSVLTSAPTHLITFISEDPDDVQIFEGIGYMRVGFDFEVGPNT